MPLLADPKAAAAAVRSIPWHAAPTRHLGRSLLDAQLWCLGQDILHAEGNLLAAFGGVRHRDGLHAGQPSCYRLVPPDGGSLRVCAWGYGLWLGDLEAGDGCFVRRKGFAPVLTSADWPWAGAFGRDDRPGRRPRSAAESARLATLVAALAEWCAGYERWIAGTVAPGWRATCESRRPRGRRRGAGHRPAATLAEGWGALRADCRAAAVAAESAVAM